MASRLVIRRRRDGLIQLRRRPAWQVMSTHETAAIFLLSAACLAVSVALVTVLLHPPLLLGIVPLLPVAVVAVWAARATRAAALAGAPLDRPPTPPRSVA